MKKVIFVLLFLPFLTFSQESNFPELEGPYLGQKPPGKTPKLFAPGIVSSIENFEMGCSFSPDGKEFYFGRTLKEGGVIYFMKNVIGKWTSPEKLDISTAKYYGEPHVNPDGDKLFFNELNPEADQPQPPRGTISTSEKTKNTWSASRVLWDGMFATTAKSGNIYYTNNEKRTIYMRIYSEGYSEAKPLLIEGCTFPTSHPYIAPDESFIIYGGFDPKGQSKGEWADLYISFRKDDGSFGKPINLGDKINNPYPNICPMVTPDGKYLFYSNKGDIYWVSAKIIEELKPIN